MPARPGGFGLCFLHLRNVKGHPWNHKHADRICCVLDLTLRIAPRKRRKRDKPEALAVPDDFNREGQGIEVELSLPAERPIRTLDRIIEWRGKPGTITVDNRPDCIRGTLLEWLGKHRVARQHVQPRQNACPERCNHTA